MVSLGLYFGEQAYLRSSWNVLDGFLVFVSIIDIVVSVASAGGAKILGVLRVLRLLRTLRPLRYGPFPNQCMVMGWERCITALNRDEHGTQHTLLQGGGAKEPRARAKIASTVFPSLCSGIAHCHLLGVGCTLWGLVEGGVMCPSGY